jgi:hypothetical protein
MAFDLNLMSLQLAPQLVDLKLGQDMERILGLEVGLIYWHLKALPPRDLLLMKGQQLLNRRGKRGQ